MLGSQKATMYKAYYQNHYNFGSNHYCVGDIIINFACIFCIPVNMQKSVNFSYDQKQLKLFIYNLCIFNKLINLIINDFNPNCQALCPFLCLKS